MRHELCVNILSDTWVYWKSLIFLWDRHFILSFLSEILNRISINVNLWQCYNTGAWCRIHASTNTIVFNLQIMVWDTYILRYVLILYFCVLLCFYCFYMNFCNCQQWRNKDIQSIKKSINVNLWQCYNTWAWCCIHASTNRITFGSDDGFFPVRCEVISEIMLPHCWIDPRVQMLVKFSKLH